MGKRAFLFSLLNLVKNNRKLWNLLNGMSSVSLGGIYVWWRNFTKVCGCEADISLYLWALFESSISHKHFKEVAFESKCFRLTFSLNGKSRKITERWSTSNWLGKYATGPLQL